MILKAVYGIVILAAVTFVQIQTGILPGILFKVFGVVVSAAVIIFAFKNYEFNLPTGKKGIPNHMGFERVQNYLRDHKGRRRIDSKEKSKIHEGMLEVDKNGDVHRIYAVIGEEFVENRTKTGETIRVIWDLTDNDFVWFDGYVPPKKRTEPFFNRNKWMEVEGYRTRKSREKDSKNSNVVIENNPSSNRGQTNYEDQQ